MNTEKKDVLHICSYYYDTKLYKNLMDKLIENKIKIDVFAPCCYNYNYNGDEAYLMQEKCFNKLDRLFFHYKYNKVYRHLDNKLDLKKYNLLHAHSLFSNGYIAYRVFKAYNIPYVVAVRNSDINAFFKYFIYLRKLGIEILENAKAIIFISNSYKDILFRKYIPKEKYEIINSKSYVIPNGIDDYYLENISIEKKRENSRGLNLVYTGKIDENKNLITTIKCCNKILKNKYDVKLTVIGKILSKRYKKIIKNNNFVNYVGPKKMEEIIDIYKDMDIFVMPSKHETFGLTYVEAMSQGLPVIYTKNEGFDLFFEPGEVGYPINYNDYNAMGEKIELILDNYNIISNNCIKKSLDFNWNDLSNKYIEIYQQIENIDA